jgi:regulator of protease activity HflC (stomatin/prohibitin superfamily)
MTSAGISFLSADGFEISLDGVVAYRVMEDKAPEVYVLYNEDSNGDRVDDEIIRKIVTPESRSICRISGSKLTGVQFISGEDRTIFQENLEKTLKENCAKQGIEILSVSITAIKPPEEIAAPVRAREVAKQQLAQFQQEKLQQESEAQLKVQTLLADQKAKLIDAQQEVVQAKTKAMQEQAVAKTLAEQKLAVAQTRLAAAVDKASALKSAAEAAANVIRFQNNAEVSGLATRVEAFGGDGGALAQNILMEKMAPAYKTILSSSDGPLMDVFKQFTAGSAARPTPLGPTANASLNRLPESPFTSSTSVEARQ